MITAMKILFRLILGFTLFSLISCEKTIEIDLGEAETIIVVNSVLDTDSLISVSLSRSRHILDNADITSVNDAVIQLFENGDFIENLFHRGNGIYLSSIKPKSLSKYKIIATHPLLNDVSAETDVLKPVPIISIDTVLTFDEYNNEVYNVSLRFKDPAGEKNYYAIAVYNRLTIDEWDSSIISYDTVYIDESTYEIHITYGAYVEREYYERVWINYNDVIVEAFSGGKILFSDDIINGELYTMRLSFSRWNLRGDKNMLYFDLISLSEPLYKYYVSLGNHFWNQGDPFAEPVVVYTNINNGVGVFGSAVKHRDSIFFEGYVFDPWNEW